MDLHKKAIQMDQKDIVSDTTLILNANQPTTSTSTAPSTSVQPSVAPEADTSSTGYTKSILDMPDEILDYIFSYLDFVQRIRLEVVCKRWHQIGRCPTQLRLDGEFLQNRKLDDNIMSSVLCRCGSALRKLTLNPTPELTCESLARIGEYCPNLVTIDLHLVDVQQINCLKMIAPGCPDLQVVRVEIHRDDSAMTSNGSDNRNSDDNGRYPDAESHHTHDDARSHDDDRSHDDTIPSLIDNSQTIATAIIRNIIDGNPENGYQNDSNPDNNHIVDGSFGGESNFQENYYEACCESYNEALLAVMQNCKAIEYLHVASLWTTSLSWMEVINPNLQTLSLENTGLTSEGMECIMERCNSIHAFSLDGCRNISQSMLFQFLRHFRRTLTQLRISYGFDWFLDWRSTLKELVNLRALDFYCCDLVDDALMDVLAKNCVNIRFLDIGGTDVTDAGLITLKALPYLRELRVTYQSSGVTGYGLESLAEKGVLRQVTISSFGSVKEICRSLSARYPNVNFIVDDP